MFNLKHKCHHFKHWYGVFSICMVMICTCGIQETKITIDKYAQDAVTHWTELQRIFLFHSQYFCGEEKGQLRVNVFTVTSDAITTEY